MTNQKFLAVLLIVFIIGAAGFLVFNKFKQEVNQAATSALPSASPQNLIFNFEGSPAPDSTSQPELPLSKNKKLPNFPGVLKPEILQNKQALILTKKGIIQLAIYPEASAAASNFMILAANGFYDGLTFHRVEPGFVVQGGDPNGDGTGGPGYQFPDEPVTRDYTKGTVAMANAGPDTNGSQFFIMLEDNPGLPKLYTIFGKVISGIEVVDKLAAGDVMQKVVIQNLK